MTTTFGICFKSAMESFKRSLNEPTPDIKILNIQMDSLLQMADIHIDKYEDLFWEKLRLREELSKRPPATV